MTTMTIEMAWRAEAIDETIWHWAEGHGPRTA